MSIKGSCRCNNIQVVWRTVDLSLVPRACQCDYCRLKNATWVSKSATGVEVTIHHESLHKRLNHGSGTAEFHECGGCDDVVFASAWINGDVYCALNAKCLHNTLGFAAAVTMNVDGQSVAQKKERWRQNWCRLLSIQS